MHSAAVRFDVRAALEHVARRDEQWLSAADRLKVQRACVCARACARVRVRERACVCVRVSACVRVRACVRACGL
jgi:hypothetical protein